MSTKTQPKLKNPICLFCERPMRRRQLLNHLWFYCAGNEAAPHAEISISDTDAAHWGRYAGQNAEINCADPEFLQVYEAARWARRAYGKGWRKKFSASLAEHERTRPASIAAPVWRHWYFAPFGDVNFNLRTICLRRFFAGEEPPADFVMQRPFTLHEATHILGAAGEDCAHCQKERPMTVMYIAPQNSAGLRAALAAARFQDIVVLVDQEALAEANRLRARLSLFCRILTVADYDAKRAEHPIKEATAFPTGLFAIYASDGGRRFSFNAPTFEAAVSKAKGWCVYHSFCFADDFAVVEVNDPFDLHNEFVDGR